MIFQFRVTLPGIKGFYRIYKVNSSNSLYSFHRQLQADLEFPVDQPILFKALDANGDVVARYAFIDLGFGTVDTISVGQAVKAGMASMIYFYDTKAKKNVILTLEAQEISDSITCPTLLDDMKGPNPIEFENGYVAFEDLPQEHRHLPGERCKCEDCDDDDCDCDDEDDEDDDNPDREEEEMVYDEKEEF